MRAGRPISHVQLGGVTDFRTGCTWLRRGNAKRVFQLDDPMGVDAPSSMVVDPRCGFRGGVPAGAPAPGDFDPQTDKLKWNWLQDGTMVVLPCAFQSSGWICRSLTPEESLKAADVPGDVWARLPTKDRSRLAGAIGTPVKVLAYLASALVDHFVALEGVLDEEPAVPDSHGPEGRVVRVEENDWGPRAASPRDVLYPGPASS
jgi:hypothetical protein